MPSSLPRPVSGEPPSWRFYLVETATNLQMRVIEWTGSDPRRFVLSLPITGTLAWIESWVGWWWTLRRSLPFGFWITRPAIAFCIWWRTVPRFLVEELKRCFRRRVGV